MPPRPSAYSMSASYGALATVVADQFFWNSTAFELWAIPQMLRIAVVAENHLHGLPQICDRFPLACSAAIGTATRAEPGRCAPYAVLVALKGEGDMALAFVLPEMGEPP